MLKSVCIIAYGYPTPDDPMMAFIQPVARGLADLGIECCVIAPQSITEQIRSGRRRRPYRWEDRTEKGNRVTIYQPRTISVSNLHLFGVYPSTVFTERAILRCFRRERLRPSVIYGHFWKSGMRAARIGLRTGIPAVAVSGESDIRSEITGYAEETIRRRLPGISGAIFVSTKNLEESRELGYLREGLPYVVLPNAYDPKDFRKTDRAEARAALGIPSDDFVGISIGAYSRRKGTERIISAAKGIPELKLILLGSGDALSDTSQVIASGSRAHGELVTYLNAADFFVLPTLAEGCCNAIVEALACGLPVISSDLPFNDDILDETNSIRVDPMDIGAIREAMERIGADAGLRERLSEGALRTAEGMTIETRARRIADFLSGIAQGTQGRCRGREG